MVNKVSRLDTVADLCSGRILDVILLSEDVSLLSLLDQTLREFEDFPQDGALRKVRLHKTSTLWEFSMFLDRCYGSCLLLVDLGSGQRWRETCLDLLARFCTAVSGMHLVIVSDRDEDAALLFQWELPANDFINKRTQDPIQCLRRCLRRLQTQKTVVQRLVVRSNGTINAVPLDNIFYIETIKGTHKSAIVCGDGSWEVWSDLCRLRAQLDARFVLCRPSVVANIRHVHRIDLRARTLHFPRGFSCSFSKSNKNAVVRAFEYMYQGGISTWQTI